MDILLIQPDDGKILLGGTCSNGSNNDFCIARFNPNGSPNPDGTSLDYTFGTLVDNNSNRRKGYIIQTILNDINEHTNAYGVSLAIQSDGKILLGGYCYNGSNGYDFCVARFKSDGSLDTDSQSGFGPNKKGYIIQSIGSDDDYGYSLVIQPDRKILLGGTCKKAINGITKNAFCIARFNPNGSLDKETFGTVVNGIPQGYITQPIGSNDDYGQSLAIDNNNKILLGGYCDMDNDINKTNYDFCVARFKSDGSSLDNTFGTNGSGYITQSIGSSSDNGYSLAIQPDGNILLGGTCNNGSNDDFCIARFNSDGTLDTTFGSSGKLTQNIGSSDDIGRSLVIQPNGNILLGGTCNNESNDDFCIARFK